MAKLLKYPELQLVEQRIENPRVGGSSPPPGTTFSQKEPRFEFQEPTLSNIATATSALGPRPGVTEGVSGSGLDLTKGGGGAGRRGLRLGPAVYLIGWRRRWRVILFGSQPTRSIRRTNADEKTLRAIFSFF